MNRRQFLRDASTTVGAAIIAPSFLKGVAVAGQSATAHVAFVRTTDRAAGVARAIDLLGLPAFHGKDLFLKPNLNSSDKTPGSTHQDTLAAIVRKLKAMGAGPLTIGDRSGMGTTREGMERKDVFHPCNEVGGKLVLF